MNKKERKQLMLSFYLIGDIKGRKQIKETMASCLKKRRVLCPSVSYIVFVWVVLEY